MAITKNLTEVIRRELASDKALAAAVDNERFNISVGAAIHEARTRAGLTQQQLAERVGMQQSAIARLENAEYDGHSLKTLQRIANALGTRIEVVFLEHSATKSVMSVEEFPVDGTEWEPTQSWWEPQISTTGLECYNQMAVA